MDRPPSIRDIAARSGYSKSTVSLALKRDPSLPEATIEKIQKAARELNYQPNPLVVSLMGSLRARKLNASKPVIAYLTAHPSRTEWRQYRTFERFYVGAEARAGSLGYTLEHFWWKEPGMNRKRLDQVFGARGIHGLILGPVPTHTEIRLSWERYAMARVGFSLHGLEGHTVANHQIRTVQLAFQKLNEKGFARVGLYTPAEDDVRVEHNWSAGEFLYRSRTPRKNWVPALLGNLERDEFLRWYARYRPEAIVSARPEVLAWLREGGIAVPDEVAFAILSADPLRPISGVNQRPEAIGAAAVDLVAEQLYNNHRGIPKDAKTVLSEGIWFQGKTTP